MLLLDAISFDPLASAYLPHNIPWSNHGMYFPEAQFTAPATLTNITARDEL